MRVTTLRPTFCGACEPLLEPAPHSLAPPRPVAALYVYGGPMADAIRRFKYGRVHEAVGPLARRLREAAPAYRGRVDRVVPIPLHPQRQRERGYNQSALLARPLARALGARLDLSLLRRTRPTLPQAGLPAERRLANVRDAFAVRADARPCRVLLVDDVRTSGATLTAAALALQAAGFGDGVCSLALASVV